MADKGVQMLITNEQFNDILDEVQAKAREVRKTVFNGGQMVPVVNVVYLHDHKVLESTTFTPHFGETSEERQAEMAKLGEVCANKGYEVMAVYITSEAWQAKATEAEVAEGVSPSQHPDRVEVLMTSGLTLDDRVNFVSDEIKGKTLKPGMYAPYRDTGDTLSPGFESSLGTAFYRGYIPVIAGNLMAKMRKKHPEANKMLDKVEEMAKTEAGREKLADIMEQVMKQRRSKRED